MCLIQLAAIGLGGLAYIYTVYGVGTERYTWGVVLVFCIGAFFGAEIYKRISKFRERRRIEQINIKANQEEKEIDDILDEWLNT